MIKPETFLREKLNLPDYTVGVSGSIEELSDIIKDYAKLVQEEQIKSCAESATVKETHFEGFEITSVDENSILNCKRVL